MKKTLCLILAFIFCLAVFSSCADKERMYGFGESFTISQLQITLNKEYSFDIVTDGYNENYGQTVVKIPVKIENKSDSFAVLDFSYSVSNPDGVHVNNCDSIFEGNLYEINGIPEGTTFEKNLYFVYDTDGTYKIEFSKDETRIACSVEIKCEKKPFIEQPSVEGYWKGMFEGLEGVVCLSPTGNGTVYYRQNEESSCIYFTYSVQGTDFRVHFLGEEHIFTYACYQDYIIIDGFTLYRTDETEIP